MLWRGPSGSRDVHACMVGSNPLVVNFFVCLFNFLSKILGIGENAMERSVWVSGRCMHGGFKCTVGLMPIGGQQSREMRESEEDEGEYDSEDCKVLLSSDSESSVSEKSIKDGSRLPLKHRGSATSQSTVNALDSTQGIIINENERMVWGMFDIEGGSKMESCGCRAEERTKKTEYHSRHRSHRSGHKFEERHFMSRSRSSVRCSPPRSGESDKCH